MLRPKLKSNEIIKGIGAGLCLLDKDFRILWVNKHQSEWFGPLKEIRGKNCYKIFEHRSHVCRGCPAAKVFKTGKIHQAKRIGITREGKKRYYHLTVSPIKDNQQRVVFALELVQDVTDVIKTEKQNLDIIHKLKHLARHLSFTNIKLARTVTKLKQVTQNTSRLKNVFKKKYRQKVKELFTIEAELKDIFRLNRTISSNVDLKKISSLICKLTCKLIHTDACVLLLLDEHNNLLSINSGFGLTKNKMQEISLRLGAGISGKVVQLGRPLAIYELDKIPGNELGKLGINQPFSSQLSVPVVYKRKTLGVISAFSVKPRHFSKEEMKVLDVFSAQVGIAIQEARNYENIHLNYFNTIHALALAVETKDVYMRGHTERVTNYALKVARALDLAEDDLEVLRYAGRVHDVGKIGIPDFILSKPGRLTSAERAVIELHPIKGAEMLEPLEFLKSAIPIVRHHHERYDGTGYPDRLAKERIPLMSRILACADAFDAMTTERPYRRRKLSPEEALAEIKNNSGSQFDPHIASTFIKTFRSRTAS